MIALIIFSAFVYLAIASRVFHHLQAWVDEAEDGYYNTERQERQTWQVTGTVLWPVWALQWPFRLAWWLGAPSKETR